MSPSSCVIWTASKPSTTPTATPPATRSSARLAIWFALILLDTSPDTAERRAELMLREFRRIVIQYGDMFLNPGALSLGVSAFPAHGNAAAALLRVADEALYRAKPQGGNRIVTGEPSE